MNKHDTDLTRKLIETLDNFVCDMTNGRDPAEHPVAFAAAEKAAELIASLDILLLVDPNEA